MNEWPTPLIAAVATGISILVLLLWSDRKYFLEEQPRNRKLWWKSASFYIMVALVSGYGAYCWQVLLVKDAEPTSVNGVIDNTQRILQSISTMDARLQVIEAKVQNKNSNQTPLQKVDHIQNNTPIQSTENEKPSDKLTLILTAMGLMIALVTSIIMTISRNAVEDMRNAVEDIERKYQLRRILEVQQTISASLQHLRITTNAAIINYLLTDKENENINYNPIPLLEIKTNFLEEALKFQQPTFSSLIFGNLIKTLDDLINHPEYKKHLSLFFNSQDVEAYKLLIDYFKSEMRESSRTDLQEPMQALIKFVRAIEKI